MARTEVQSAPRLIPLKRVDGLVSYDEIDKAIRSQLEPNDGPAHRTIHTPNRTSQTAINVLS